MDIPVYWKKNIGWINQNLRRFYQGQRLKKYLVLSRIIVDFTKL